MLEIVYPESGWLSVRLMHYDPELAFGDGKGHVRCKEELTTCTDLASVLLSKKDGLL